MDTSSNHARTRIWKLVTTVAISVLMWSTPLIGTTAQARDPEQVGPKHVEEEHRGEAESSRWDGRVLWAQRKKRTRAQRRRAAQARRARAQKVKQEDTKAESDQETSAESESASGAADALQPSSLTRELGEGQSLQRSNEMQFDDRLIRGEKAGSGAVILFDRRARRLPRLTRDRRNFFQQTVRVVLGKEN